MSEVQNEKQSFSIFSPPNPLKGEWQMWLPLWIILAAPQQIEQAHLRSACTRFEHPPLGGLGDVMQPGCRDAACRVISLAGDSTQNTQIMNLFLVAARPSFCTQIITDLEGFFIC